MPDYGSGLLGDWTSNVSSVSTPQTIANADVWMFGDSIAKATQKPLAVRLLAERGQTIAVHTQGGRPTVPSVDILEDWLGSYEPPPQIIMATGTNDIFNPPVMAAQIERTMSLLNGRSEVFWKDVQVQRWAYTTNVQIADQRNTGWVNQQIHNAVGRHGQLHLIPWFSSLASKPSRLTSYLRDGVHTSDPLGTDYHNEVVLQALPFTA